MVDTLKKLLRTKNKRVFFIYTFMILGGLTVVVLSIIKGSGIVEVISELVAILGVELLVVELYQARKISQAEFIETLNQNFISNEDYKKAYTMFEQYDFENCPDLDIENIDISNYLTFFETFQLLIDRRTLSIDLLNDLFGYRFFLAVHNPYVQKVKIIKSPQNFKNLFVLEKEWMAYRKAHGYDIFHEEYSFENQIDSDTYNKMLNG